MRRVLTLRRYSAGCTAHRRCCRRCRRVSRTGRSGRRRRAARPKYGSPGTRETDTPAVMTVSGNRVARRSPTVTQVSSSIVSCSQPAATASSPKPNAARRGGDPGRVVDVRLTERNTPVWASVEVACTTLTMFTSRFCSLGVLGAADTMHVACVACCTPSHVSGPDWAEPRGPLAGRRRRDRP